MTVAPIALRRAVARWPAPLVAWAASRALILVAAVAASAAFGVPTRGVDAAVPDLLRQIGGWDTTWYLDVARNGYAEDLGQVGEVFTNLAFFPLLPGIMAAFSAVGVNPFIGALVVSNLAFLGALWALHALTAGRWGEETATRATWVLALAPPALYCSMAYTEGLAVACAVAAALCAVRGRWVLAGLIAAAAALTRPTGVLVALLVGLLALYGPAPGRIPRALVAVVPSIVAVGAFLTWMAIARGDPLLPLEAQRAWGRGQLGVGLFTAAPTEVAAGWELVREGDLTAAWHATARDLGFLVAYLWLLARLWRAEGGLRSPWVAYSLAVIAIPLSSGTITSMARFGLMAFPLVWPLGDWLAEDRRRVRPAAAAAVVLTLLMIAQLTMRAP
ncbi:MAG: hypothetical protein JHC74_14620 [Thermoleophilia bacterium]|nr:hypothetical protein [Thermoleophilia bacterium]